MKLLKWVAYAVLLVLVVFFFRKFRAEYALASQSVPLTVERRSGLLESTNTPATTAEPTNATVRVETPVKEKPDEGVATTSPPTPPDAPNNSPAADPGTTPTTPSAGSETNTSPASTNAASTTSKAAKPVALSSTWPAYLGAFLVSLMGLAGLGAWDFARSIANRAHSAAFMEDTSTETDANYELAEESWKNGNYLEAIELMREYLQKNPSEQHVAIRIAEIYEKDLNNPTAAVMELEEVLGKKLPREKWGWTAIHLANLYSGKLAQPDKALALLNRVINEYPETGAARKARSRLGIPEPSEVPSSPEATQVATDSPPAQEGDPDSQLPRGFRPKK